MLVIGVVAAMLGAGTMAYFSDTETSEGNTFTAGTLDIELYGTSSAIWTYTDMKPGDVIYPAFIVKNAGSLTVSDILQTLWITNVPVALDDYLAVYGFWVGVFDTEENAKRVIPEVIATRNMPGPDPGFNPYSYARLVKSLAETSQNLGGIDITNDGNVPGQVLHSGEYLVYIYEMEFVETGGDQNDAQGDSLELTMTLNAEQ